MWKRERMLQHADKIAISIRSYSYKLDYKHYKAYMSGRRRRTVTLFCLSVSIHRRYPFFSRARRVIENRRAQHTNTLGRVSDV